jgi:hypothetical protein
MSINVSVPLQYVELQMKLLANGSSSFPILKEGYQIVG